MPSNDKVIGLDFSMSELFVSGLIIQDILGWWKKNGKNYRNHYREK